MGDFVQSPLGDRNGEGKILVYQPGEWLKPIVDFYRGEGYEADLIADGSAFSPGQYRLIFFQVSADPVEWAEIIGGSWSGRVVLIGEYWSFFAPANATNLWINSKQTITGMEIPLPPGTGGDSAIDSLGPSGFGPVVAHALTAGMETFYRHAVWMVAGGNPLAQLITEPGTFICEATLHGISWVVAADSNCFVNPVASWGPEIMNPQFLRNLIDVTV